MATTHEIKAQGRKDEGKGASRRLRHAGFVPAVVYGAGSAPESIQIEHNTILLAAKHEWFFKLQMLHMDFLRVDENAPVRISVPLHFLNQEKSPAAKTSGVVISHNLTEVEISCLPRDLPEFIELDLADVKPGDIIHLSELKLPKGVEIVALHLGADHDTAVVTANTVKEEVDAAPAEGEAAPAPEAPKK
jgi:large subunit ribosomal protein L25